MGDECFTADKVIDLVLNHNWTLVRDDGMFRLQQADKSYMKTRPFEMSAEDTQRVYDAMQDELDRRNEEG